MSETVEAESERYYGEDCPQGKVQIEFVGVDPKLRYSEYGWKPSDYAFIEVWVDGQRFRIDVGTFESSKGPRRGLHIVTCGGDLVVDKHSINAVDVFLQKRSIPPSSATAP